MQCFERQAMYLKLYAIAAVEIPRLEFDRSLLDDVLAEFGVEKFTELMELEKTQRNKIIMRIRSLTEGEAPRKDESDLRRERTESFAISNYALRKSSPSSSIRRHQPTIFP